MSTEVRKKPLACQEELFLYLLLIFWLAVFWPWTQSIRISSSVFCLQARHLPHNRVSKEYPMRRVGCRWSCVGIYRTGEHLANAPPPQRCVISWVSADSRQTIVHGFALPAFLPAYSRRRYIPLEAVHDALHRRRCQPRGGGGEDNVCSHCISLCSLIIYPCRQRRCHICIQVQRGIHTRLTSDSLIFPQPVYFRFRVLCENDRWNTDYLYSGI